MSDASRPEWLIVRAGTRRCALALADVVEIMRPQPITALPGLPASVLGSAVVRGDAVPVVHAASLLGEAVSDPLRLVTLRVADRYVALAVDDVIGLRRTDATQEAVMPPLLAGAAQHAVSALRVADSALVLVLDGMRLVPPDVWATLD
jgi:purine-binding chemotaxis protein CheW